MTTPQSKLPLLAPGVLGLWLLLGLLLGNLGPINATTNAIDDGINCPSEQDDRSVVVQFPSPTDCSVFYKCNRGVPHMIKCPDALHYNVEIQACDFPVRAKCELRNLV